MNYGNQSGASGAGMAASIGQGNYQGDIQAANSLKSPSVMEQLNIQEKVIVGAHGVLDQLVDRLSPILGPVPGNGVSGEPAPPTPTQLSQRIPIHTRGIEALVARMQQIVARIEL